MERNNTKKLTTIQLVTIPLCTAIIAILSQIAIPFIAGIPFTMQTLAIALTGFILGKRDGLFAVIVYILLGIAGIPVFAFYSSGIGVIVGITGGYIWGFLLMVFLCGLSNEKNSIIIKIILAAAGLVCCHLFGVIQFSFVGKTTMLNAFLTASAPYIVKDIVSIILAYSISIPIKKALKTRGSKV